jgi:F-type H+-transporting ATPase subunit delta
MLTNSGAPASYGNAPRKQGLKVAESVSISSGIAGRYAAALFDLSQEAGTLAALEGDVETMAAALGQSRDLQGMIASPIINRAEQGAAIGAVARALGLSELFLSTLALMATKRRLFVLPQLLGDLRARIAAAKNEVTAEVASATKLSAAQSKALAAAIKSKVGKTVKLSVTVDEALIGGLVVKVGSTMIDTSIRSKLAALQNAMKEVG